MEEGVPQEPAPGRKGAGTHSGRLLLRMPESLHAELARASERAGVSLNGYINDALARAVGKQPAPARAAAARPVRRRFVERLLLVNLVVVAVVGALVVVLIVQALR
jgi:HicB family